MLLIMINYNGGHVTLHMSYLQSQFVYIFQIKKHSIEV